MSRKNREIVAFARLNDPRQSRGHILVYAQENVDFYQSLFEQNNVNPRDITSLDQISQLPFTQKSDLVNNYPSGLCAVKPSEVIRVHASSGTTGKPINTYYTKKDLEDWRICMGRNLRIAGVTKYDVCQIAFRYTLFTGAFGHHLGAESCGAMVIPTSSGQTERQHVEEGLGVISLRDYGLTELGGPGVSIECPHKTGFHINEDYFYPEIIDPVTLKPLPHGRIGELVFTSLQKEAMPLIRYRTRDISHLMYDTCPCGRTLVRHGPILGRNDDMLIVGGVNFFPSQLESVLLAFVESAAHYIIHLKKTSALDEVSADVEAVPEFWSESTQNTRSALAKRIEARIKDILGFSISVQFVEPNSIPRSEGKSKRVFDHR